MKVETSRADNNLINPNFRSDEWRDPARPGGEEAIPLAEVELPAVGRRAQKSKGELFRCLSVWESEWSALVWGSGFESRLLIHIWGPLRFLITFKVVPFTYWLLS